VRHVVVAGMGAVSPAGWGVKALCEAAAMGAPMEITTLQRPNLSQIGVRMVPTASENVMSRFRHPRLRRVSAISRYAVAAALEALEEASGFVDPSSASIGVLFCTTCGCVGYSRRFYQEVMDDPGLASPMLFPETVFNAPASHLAAVLGNSSENYTFAGDASSVLQALAMGANRLISCELDACLVVAAEEGDWLIADAFRLFSKSVPIAEGAGAVVLTLSDQPGPRLDTVTDQHFYSPSTPRDAAVKQMADQLSRQESGAADLLSLGVSGSAKLDRAELSAWSKWNGATLRVKQVIGEGFAAGAMWQVVAALSELRKGNFKRALVSVPGAYQFAIGAAFSL